MNFARFKKNLRSGNVPAVMEYLNDYFQLGSEEQELVAKLCEFIVFKCAQMLRSGVWTDRIKRTPSGNFIPFEELLKEISFNYLPYVSDATPPMSIIKGNLNAVPTDKLKSYRLAISRLSKLYCPSIILLVIGWWYLKVMNFKNPNIILSRRYQTNITIVSLHRGNDECYNYRYHCQKISNLSVADRISIVQQCRGDLKMIFEAMNDLNVPVNLSFHRDNFLSEMNSENQENSPYQDFLFDLIKDYFSRYAFTTLQLDQTYKSISGEILNRKQNGEDPRMEFPIHENRDKEGQNWKKLISSEADAQALMYICDFVANDQLLRVGNYPSFVVLSQYLSVEELIGSGLFIDKIDLDDPQLVDWIATEKRMLQRFLRLERRNFSTLLKGFVERQDAWVDKVDFFPEEISNLTGAQNDLYWIHNAQSSLENLPTDNLMSLVLGIVNQHSDYGRSE